MVYPTPRRTPSRRKNSYKAKTPNPQYIARQLFTAAAQGAAYKAGESAVNYMTKSKTKSGVATTTQHDVSRQYRYKRMPRRKRRRWVKALKRNAAMDMAESATQTIIYNTVLEGRLDHIVNGRTQNWIAAHLYGCNGIAPSPIRFAQEVGVEDIKALKNLDKRTAFQFGNSRVKFESGIMDLTIKNPNVNNGLEVDVYEVVYRSSSKHSSLMSLHQEMNLDTPSNRLSPDPNDRAQWDTRGITPFDTVQFGAAGCKILSKKKVFLPPGNTFTYQYRDPKNHYFGPDDFDDSTGFIIPKATRTILFVYKSITGEPLPTGTDNELRMFVGVSRIYKYKIKGEVESGIIVG